MIFLFFGLMIYGHVATASGPYTDSAHGNNSYGVKRDVTQLSSYARGNCAHCHEQHASIGELEPEPSSGSASPFCIFADNFSGATLNPYSQSDDFCFYCHCYPDVTTLQMTPHFTNYDYSCTFGGYSSSTPASIFAAFNQTSYHNLDDIQDFAHSNFSSFFKSDSNPCVACHNPHLAKRNKENKSDPTYSAISKPSDHFSLWTNTMNDYAPSSYQAPYRYSSGCEPDGGTCSDLTGQSQKTPDYVTFCQDCHSSLTGYSLPHSSINWNIDKHGTGAAGDCCDDIKLPYQQAQCGGYILSCLDCHEPHGAPYIFLIRPEVNKGGVAVLTGTGSGPDGRPNKEWVYLCGKCHDGLLANDSNHPHPANVPPDTVGVCSSWACHGGGGEYRPCGECHYHGSDSINGVPYGEALF